MQSLGHLFTCHGNHHESILLTEDRTLSEVEEMLYHRFLWNGAGSRSTVSTLQWLKSMLNGGLRGYAKGPVMKPESAVAISMPVSSRSYQRYFSHINALNDITNHNSWKKRWW
jgi:hypothetical protein